MMLEKLSLPEKRKDHACTFLSRFYPHSLYFYHVSIISSSIKLEQESKKNVSLLFSIVAFGGKQS